MTSPRVLTYLRDHSVAELFAEHGVRVSVATANPYKASLNYDQLTARNNDPLASQCRGLVLATIDGTPFPTDGPCGDLMVLARPMDRFFNLGHGPDGSADIIDEDLAHPDARVYEKLDGMLCIMYYDPHAPNQGELGDPSNPASYGAWCVATRSVPDADRVVDGFGDHTFRSLFEHAIRNRVHRSMFGGLIEGDGLPVVVGAEGTHTVEVRERTDPRGVRLEPGRQEVLRVHEVRRRECRVEIGGAHV